MEMKKRKKHGDLITLIKENFTFLFTCLSWIYVESLILPEWFLHFECGFLYLLLL